VKTSSTHSTITEHAPTPVAAAGENRPDAACNKPVNAFEAQAAFNGEDGWSIHDKGLSIMLACHPARTMP